MKTRIIESLLVTVLTVVSLLLFAKLQHQLIAHNGIGWDAIEYAKIYAAISTGNFQNIPFPYCNRVGTPLLAHLTQINGIGTAFQVVNSFFAVIFSVTIYLTARKCEFNIYYSAVAWSLTIIPFFSPARFIPYFPIYSDPASLAFISIAFYQLIKRNYGTAFFFVLISYPFRESALYILPFFYISSVYISGPSKKNAYLFIFYLMATIALKFLIQRTMECHGSQLGVAVDWVIEGLTKPERFIAYVAAISMTAAPILFLKDIKGDNKITIISCAGLLGAALLAFAGGSDSTRIFYSFFPLYFIAIIYSIQTRGYIFSIFAIWGYVLTNRFGHQIQEPLNYWPNNDESGLFWQFPDHARPEVALIILAIWMILFVFYNAISSWIDRCAKHPGDVFSDRNGLQ